MGWAVLLQKVPHRHCCNQCPQPCNRPPLTHASAGDSWTLTSKSGSVSCEVTAPFSWVLVHTGFGLWPPRVLCKFWQLDGGVSGDFLQEGLCHTQVYCTQRPCPIAVHCWPVPPQEMPKHCSASVSMGSLGRGAHKVCLSPLSISGRCGVWL